MIEWQKEDDRILHIVMEHMDGITLVDLFEQRGALSEEQIKKLFFRIMIGVSHMHSANVIHRDLTLNNILVKFEDHNNNFDTLEEIKIIDLGFATVINENTKGFCGSPT